MAFLNIVSPQNVTSAGLSSGVARSVSRQVFLRLPDRLLRRMLGEFADNFRISADVRPGRLTHDGFIWELPDFDQAVRVAAQELGFPISLPEITTSTLRKKPMPKLAARQKNIVTPDAV